MKIARLAVLGVALAAGGGAAFFVSGRSQPPAQIVQAAPTIKTDEVLVAAKDVALGTLVAAMFKIAPELNMEIVRQAYAIERDHQFDTARDIPIRSLQKLVENLVATGASL